MPELAFLVPDRGADGAADLGLALSREVAKQDAAALLCRAAAPDPRPDRVQVLLHGAGGGEAEASLAASPRTIAVLLAAPGTERFERGVELAQRAGASFHVNSVACERLLELGVPARHLQLGYSEDWAEPDPGADPLTVIAAGDGYFDWPRALRAIHAGSAVLHERALGVAPLVAGRHLFVAEQERLEAVAAALRSDPARLESVSGAAQEFVSGALPLALAAAALIGAARTLVAQPLSVGVESTPGQPSPVSK